MEQVELKGVDILPTQKCVSRCRHCSYRSSPAATGEMTAKEAERYTTEASRFGIDWIWIGGGEPLLCRDVLLCAANAARKAGVPDVYVVTNGYWAIDPEATAKEVESLRRAGVSILGVSIDAFHQEYVSLKCVETLLKAAEKAGFRLIEASGQFLGSVDFGIEFNWVTERNLKILERQGYLDGVKVNREVLRLCGRAADLLTPFLSAKKEEELTSAKCDPRWLPVESLGKLRAVEIDWQGNVTTCPGICVGNTSQASLKEMLREYDYSQHPIVKILVEQGPHGLFQLAKDKGYAPHGDGFCDGCHMCFEARRYLSTQCRRHLRPDTCYLESATA